MTSTVQARARSRRLLPPAAAAAVAAAVAVVVAVVGLISGVGSSGPTRPPVLHLAGVAGGSVGLPASSAAGASDKAGAPSPGAASVSGAEGSRWRLAGTLPKGPSSGRVYLLPAGASTRSLVSTLALALGMSGEPKHLKGGWYLASGTTELSVSELEGRHWTFSNHGCIAGPVLDPQTGAACAVAQSSRPTNPAPVPESVARRLARPVLEAVGVSPGAATVDTSGGLRSVVFSPTLAGSSVLGLVTQVSVNDRGQIGDASGWLATPTAAAAYPLISARQGYDQLLQQPQPMIASRMMPCRILPGKADCGPAPGRVVTGATLGLTQAYTTDRGIMLVPAWLFQVRGEPTPAEVVAVQQVFLGQPGQHSPGAGPAVGSRPGGSPN